MQLDIPALVIPGHDASHATSAARYLEECLPRSEYWDIAVADQTGVYRAAAAPGISAKSSSTVIRLGMMPCS